MMCRQLRGPLSLIIAIAALILLSTYPAALADNEEALSLRSVLSEFGLSAKHRKQLEDGAIVSVVAEPAFRKELTGAVAMRLPVRISEIAQRIRTGINITADPGMTEYGEIDSEHNETDLERAAFSSTELEEALRLFHVHPGKELNLSAAEIAVVGERLGVYPAPRDGRDVLAEASAAYRMVLAGRVRAYRERGLAGLAAYDRGDGSSSSPGDELLRVRTAFSPIPALAPLLRALDAFPQPPPSTMDQRFYWKKTSVNDRPAFVLAHVLLEERPNRVAFVLREYYVGHSYNVLHQIGVALPQGEGSVVVALNSTVTDAIPAVLGSLARAIGRGRAREALEDYFEGIRRSVIGASAGRP